MEKTINLGKIDYYGIGRKENLVTITIKLREEENKKIFSASGNVWNRLKTDTIIGGQCLDDLNEFKTIQNNKTFKIIYYLWKNYHLNNSHPGTKKQEFFLKQNISKHNWNYKKCCNLLKRHGLLHDKDQNNYRYGSDWLYEEIPQEDLNKIYKILEEA